MFPVLQTVLPVVQRMLPIIQKNLPRNTTFVVHNTKVAPRSAKSVLCITMGVPQNAKYLTHKIQKLVVHSPRQPPFP